MPAKKNTKPNKKQHNILIVDDEPSVLKALERTFSDSYNVFPVSNGKDALKLFKTNDIHLVIADQKMPNMSGIDLLEKIKKLKPSTIKIMLTAYTDISDIIDSINRCDLHQYITKPWEDTFIRLSVKKALESYDRAVEIQKHTKELEVLNKNLSHLVEERTKELVQANKELEKLAITDPLTGLNNRRYFEERLKKEFTRVKRYSHPISLVMIDIDHFKKYNDEHGHLLGDSVLKELSKIFISRYGGEEFVLTLPETDKKGALEIAERIRAGVEIYDFPHSLKCKTGKISISMGIASFPEDSKDCNELLNKADQTMYIAKKAGRNRIVTL